MLSALIHTKRSCAACYITTAYQGLPITVPLVLDDRSAQTTARLVDIIQTVSRIYSLFMILQCMDYTFTLLFRVRGSACYLFIRQVQHFRVKSLRGQRIIYDLISYSSLLGIIQFLEFIYKSTNF